ncbi:MAG: hypothetical protein IKX03_06270 [Bacteroidales bacterium]|nr:hypothetical protein [Bacteroidales bacterium]
MRTEISTIGKEASILKLFEGTGFKNERTPHLSEKGEVVTSHKIMLEGVDFDLVYTPLKHLGYKAALYAMGDVFAALRQPVALTVQLGLSSRFCYEDMAEFWAGILAAAKEHDLKHLGLDLNPSVNGLCISLAASGVQRKAVVEAIPEPKNMDLICLTGRLGAAYMGLHILEREKVSFNRDGAQPDLSKYKGVLASYLSPEIKQNVVSRFVDDKIYPSSGYFVTRGLGDAALRLAADSGFGVKIYLEKIPLSDQTFTVAEKLGIDPVTAAMNGGDDYQFIFTVPIEKHNVIRKDFQDYDVIGHLARPEAGVVIVTPEGAEIPVHAQGYTAVEPEATQE